MNMVIGGAFQKKYEYARNTFGLEEGWIDGADCPAEQIYTCKGIRNFHLLVKRLLENDCLPDDFGKQICERNKDLLIVTDELGYGVVPMDAFDRNYRETTGRICEVLAANSSQVHRVVCGIGVIIKNA